MDYYVIFTVSEENEYCLKIPFCSKARKVKLEWYVDIPFPIIYFIKYS